jgi:hypothetical protein
MIYCPKGLHDSARGFNPGNATPRPCALQGREIEQSKNTRPPCNDLSPLQGESRDWDGSQG